MRFLGNICDVYHFKVQASGISPMKPAAIHQQPANNKQRITNNELSFSVLYINSIIKVINTLRE